MITNCIVIYALLVSSFGYDVADQYYEMSDCNDYIPESCMQYAPLLVKHFDEENIENAVKIMWCESRNKATAYRYQADDSGLFQVIPRTYGWVQENYDLLHWDYPVGNTFAQFVPETNIKVAAILAEDIHTVNPYWKPWDASRWCWEDTDKWISRWQKEENY